MFNWFPVNISAQSLHGEVYFLSMQQREEDDKIYKRSNERECLGHSNNVYVFFGSMCLSGRGGINGTIC